MKTFLLLSQLFLLPLFAKEATTQELNSIYTEAILFVAVFALMGIVSYIYSKKHAKEYKPQEKKEKELENNPYSKRREELLEMLNNKLLTQEEFDILSQYYINKS